MADFKIKLGNFLYRNAFFLYKPMYSAFKRKQDDFEISILKKYIQSGDVVLDIGANIGFYAGILSELVGEKGKVFCFEPDKKNFIRLQKSIAPLKNVEGINKAVSDKSGSIKIYTSKELNVDHRTYQPEEFESVLEIESVSIDDFIPKGVHVDFIKMDIQGYEQSALKGMLHTLQANSKLKIISEFWPYGLKQAGGDAVSYYHSLCELGFNVYLMEGNALSELNANRVATMNELPKEKYFNIFLSKFGV